MTPEQKLKWAVLAKVAGWKKTLVPDYPCANVDELYAELVALDLHWDGRNELRCGQVETGLPCPSSRSYDGNAVAMQMPDGSWVGWTYWSGGGKYGNPEELDWMDSAYDVDRQSEEKVVVVHTFKLREAAAV